MKKAEGVGGPEEEEEEETSKTARHHTAPHRSNTDAEPVCSTLSQFRVRRGMDTPPPNFRKKKSKNVVKPSLFLGLAIAETISAWTPSYHAWWHGSADPWGPHTMPLSLSRLVGTDQRLGYRGTAVW